MADDCDVVLINPPHHKRLGSGIVFPLGLGYIKAYLKSKGYRVIIVDCATIIQSLDANSLKILRVYLKDKFQELVPNYAIGIGPCTTPAVSTVNLRYP